MDADILNRSFQNACTDDAPLDRRLHGFTDAVRSYAAPFANAYDALVAHLRSKRAGSAAPKVGDRMPSFLLPDKDGRLLDMADLLETGPAVISFNRGHWCEYCGIELAALTQAKEQIEVAGATLVSVVPEKPEFTRKLSARIGHAFQVLSDFDNSYSRSLDLDIPLGARVRKLYLEHGLRIDAYQGNDHWVVPIPATYVVDRDRTILACQVDPDFRNRMNVEKVLQALQTRVAAPSACS